MFYPSLPTAVKLASSENYGCIPISLEMNSISITPMEVLGKLKAQGKPCYLFESAEVNHERARYTFLGYDPCLELSCLDGKITLRRGATSETMVTNPSKLIREIIQQNKSPLIKGFPPFTGGLVGHFSFEYIRYSEPSLDLNAPDPVGFNDTELMVFEQVIVFDHLLNKILLIANVKCDQIKSHYPSVTASLIDLKELILSTSQVPEEYGEVTSSFKMLFSEEEFSRKIEEAQDAIKRGDFNQVVLANSLEADYEGSLLGTYGILRTINPSPYMFYLGNSDVEIVGASPETLVRVEENVVRTFPLAGTRPRGRDQVEDKEFEAELLADPKEVHEHEMLVDLGRQDLNKVCVPETIKVAKKMTVERFSHVMHLGSTVEGNLRSGFDALHALEATLPAGTLSGTPKVKACQLINDLEGQKRGIYGGAIGYLGFNGNLDTCIAIRLAYQKNGKVYVRTGAGIVSESDPRKEYEECNHKAKAMLEAFKIQKTFLKGVGS